MDGGEREKAVSDGIKQIVKYTSRRKVPTRSAKVQVLAPKLIEDAGAIPISVSDLHIDEDLAPPLKDDRLLEQNMGAGQNVNSL